MLMQAKGHAVRSEAFECYGVQIDPATSSMKLRQLDHTGIQRPVFGP
ncbi:hypothetical protein [Bradyrhizobium paxllaeri]|nr:hypothetical protein [Bradyrhizobium paxllaeri]